MNFLPFFLLAAGLRTFIQPLQQMTMLEVKVHSKRMVIMTVIIFATFHAEFQNNFKQVGQAIIAEGTTLAPWGRLGRRASRCICLFLVGGQNWEGVSGASSGHIVNNRQQWTTIRGATAKYIKKNHKMQRKPFPQLCPVFYPGMGHN